MNGIQRASRTDEQTVMICSTWRKAAGALRSNFNRINRHSLSSR